ncbi:MAG: short-chain dehydrogenase, partial [Castellaniella sp.]
MPGDRSGATRPAAPASGAAPLSGHPERVFITGAGSGIGAALARRYAARGAVLG